MRLTARRMAAVVCLVLMVALTVLSSAFAEEAMSAPLGSWAFTHDPQTTILSIADDGNAVFYGHAYTWCPAEGSVVLTGSDGSQLTMRWSPCESGIVLYIPTVYEREQGASGLIGSWKALGSSESSFIFASNGHFLEDGVFTGTYAVDEENAAITLQYGGLFADTVVYYAFADDFLTVSYPWTMVGQS